MRNFLFLIFVGLLLNNCGGASGLSYAELEKPINSYGGHVRMYGNPYNPQVNPIANKQCQRFDPQSKAINIKQVHAGSLFSGSEYSYWHYSCETSAQREATKKIELASMMSKAKSTCKELGFNEGTDKYADCALKLYSQSIELAAKQNQQVVVQGQSSGVMTIYDPARESRVLINKGQRMLSGACTLGIDC